MTVAPVEKPSGTTPPLKLTFTERLAGAYDTFKTDPSPDNLNTVVDHLKPTMQYALSTIGAADDPYMKGQAKLVAAQAIKKFDPTAGAALPTWVSGHLMQLRRIRRLSSMPIKIPERTQLSAYQMMKAEMEFMDREGREPDLLELADEAKMPVRQIEKIRRSFRKMPSQTGMGEAVIGAASPDFTSESLDYLYHDLDRIDRKILEYRTGYGGGPILSGPEVAQRLNITPTQLSRRSARISMRLQGIESNLASVAAPNV